jgi:hypothetical protein
VAGQSRGVKKLEHFNSKALMVHVLFYQLIFTRRGTMKKLLAALVMAGVCMSPMLSQAVDLKAGEKAVVDELKAAIPADRIVPIEKLYAI